MNIYKHEFNKKISSILIWSISIASLIFSFMALFRSFAENSALVSSLMESFPPELLTAFGMNDMDWSTILGYLSLLFVFVQICLAIQAANYGFALVSIEEAEWTADFLLAKPVKRSTILSSKLIAALTALGLTEAITALVCFFTLRAFSQGQMYDQSIVVVLLLSMPVFQLFFMTLGILISQFVKRVRNVTSFSMGLVFSFYILNAFSDMVGEKSLEILSPFQHFAPNFIVKHGNWDFPTAWISIIIIVVSVVGSYFLYSRRNIASAV